MLNRDQQIIDAANAVQTAAEKSKLAKDALEIARSQAKQREAEFVAAEKELREAEAAMRFITLGSSGPDATYSTRIRQ